MLPVSELRKILLDLPLPSESGLWTRAVRYQLLQKAPPGFPSGSAPRYRSTKNIRGGVNLMVFSDRLKPGQPSYLSVYDPSGLLRQKLPEKRI